MKKYLNQMKVRSYTVGGLIADIEAELQGGWQGRQTMLRKRELEKEMFDLDVEMDRAKSDHILYSDLLITFIKDLEQLELKLQELESRML